MEDKQLIEKYSVIIAEFMGYHRCFQDHFQNTETNDIIFKGKWNYHTDWNEIHKVINKIEEQYPNEYRVCYLPLKTSIDEAFLEIGKCIEYLNTIKQITQ